MTDGSSDSTSAKAVSDAPSSPTGSAPSRLADDFHPDVPTDLQVGTVAAPDPSTPTNGESSDADLETTAFGAGDPIGFDAPSPAESESSAPSDEQHLVPGASIARGRYRLLVFHGGAPHLQFWQALDTALNRQVALTFVDPDGTLPDEQIREILARTMQAEPHRQARHRPHSRRGRTPAPAAWSSPSGSAAVRCRRWPTPRRRPPARRARCKPWPRPPRPPTTPASRCRSTTRAGCGSASRATSCSHSRRPCRTPARKTTSAASAPRCMRCWSTSGRCPSPASRAGWRRRRAIPPANLLEPSAIDGDIPFQISAAATHSIQVDGGIRSAATLLNLLQQATVVADRTELLAPINENTPPPAPARPGRERAPDLDEAQARLRRRRAITIGVGAGAAIIVVALLVLASVLSRMFSDVGGLDKDQLGLNGPSTSTSGDSVAAGSIVKPVSATVFSPGGEADNPASGRAGDRRQPGHRLGDRHLPRPGTVPRLQERRRPDAAAAATHRRRCRQRRPAQQRNQDPDPLVGDGDAGQARGHHRAEPAGLDAPGHNTIPVNASSPTSYVLVWISDAGHHQRAKAAPASPRSPCKPSPEQAPHRVKCRVSSDWLLSGRGLRATDSAAIA